MTQEPIIWNQFFTNFTKIFNSSVQAKQAPYNRLLQSVFLPTPGVINELRTRRPVGGNESRLS